MRRRRRPRRLWPLSIAALTLVAVAVALVLDASLDRGGTDPSEAAAPAPAQLQARDQPDLRRGQRDREPASRRGAGESGSSLGIEWRRSEPVGTHSAGRLERGVMLPARGREWVSWDPILKRRPNRWWRRWGTDRLVRTTLKVLRRFGRAHPGAPRVAVGDLSRPKGGDFGPQFGSIGHASHQNGLDVDVYYPRTDRRVRPPKRAGEVDVRLAQDLVDSFVVAGAEKVFVGPSLPLDGPAGVVVPVPNHDNHLHVRLPLT